MIEGLKVLALIPARAGSKGLERKNQRLLGGKPLVAWTIEAALGVGSLDRVIMSTEDPELGEIAKAWGCDVPFVRPAELASDTARNIDVVHHALACVDEVFDIIVLLQPTSPFRSSDDIERAVGLLVEHDAPACISVRKADENPYFFVTLGEKVKMNPVLPLPVNRSRRQQFPEFYVPNGAMYLARTEWIKTRDSFLSPDTLAFTMDERSSIDIDDEEDLSLARRQLSPSKNGG